MYPTAITGRSDTNVPAEFYRVVRTVSILSFSVVYPVVVVVGIRWFFYQLHFVRLQRARTTATHRRRSRPFIEIEFRAWENTLYPPTPPRPTPARAVLYTNSFTAEVTCKFPQHTRGTGGVTHSRRSCSSCRFRDTETGQKSKTVIGIKRRFCVFFRRANGDTTVFFFLISQNKCLGFEPSCRGFFRWRFSTLNSKHVNCDKRVSFTTSMRPSI